MDRPSEGKVSSANRLSLPTRRSVDTAAAVSGFAARWIQTKPRRIRLSWATTCLSRCFAWLGRQRIDQQKQPFHLEQFECSLIGDQAINQDAVAHHIGDDWALLLVADGLGGYPAGEVASAKICKAVIDRTLAYIETIQADPLKGMRSCLQQATSDLQQYLALSDDTRRAQTTLALVWLNADHLITAHIGDSRVYLVDEHQIHWQTRDHSVTQMLLDEGSIGEDQMGDHPDQGKLFRCLGVERQDTVKVRAYPALKPGQLLLLCSDGFWGGTRRDEIIALAAAENLSAALQQRAACAVKRAQGDSDNVSAQIARWAQIQGSGYESGAVPGAQL